MIITKYSKLKLFLYTIIFALFMFMSISVRQQVISALPEAVEYVSKNNTDYITLSEIKQAVNNSDDIMTVNVQNRKNGTAEAYHTSLLSDNVNIILTDENYPEIHNINMIKGNFFSAVISESDAIVISDSLANLLFKSIDIIGCQMILNGETKTISGVYENNESFVSDLSSNGLETVFVPVYYQTDINDSTRIESFYVKGNNGSIGNKEIQELNALLNNKLELYKQNDLNSSKKLLMQLFNIIIFVIGLIVVVKLFSVIIKNIKKIVNYIIAVKGFDNAVPSVNVKLCILGTILCIAFIIPIIVLCTFKIYIPEGFIPEHDRICDISYYYDYMLNFVQGIRTEDRWNYYQELILSFYVILFVLGISTVIMFIKTFFMYIKFFRTYAEGFNDSVQKTLVKDERNEK
ncbi:ABC transporter permease [Porcipelethomonas ammoniilytica]|uniref:ABC transporter permease n=2 Tax=Oscillospiraceae TaxID=216572 RepID=UPI000821D56B|nr:ABC transporter permease [Porcipelethomonas ammoniilytica]MBS6315237.1 ABC transporter permease [Ruminococcus sp.]MCU6719985.1 ABC transporter permease [Porcipelethomonas ammoniilytica]SCI98380.1 MacB-like periplasmic core domain [uncultured Ruminococcus sp.]